MFDGADAVLVDYLDYSLGEIHVTQSGYSDPKYLISGRLVTGYKVKDLFPEKLA